MKNFMCPPRSALTGILLLLAGTVAEARPRIGLTLGGGSARGLAHVGVLAWMEEHRIPVDFVAGTSMGGLVGGAYASGMSPDEIRAMLREVDWDLVFEKDPPYRLRSYRRKEDARAFPVGIELGLKGGLRLPSGLNPGHHVGLLLSRIALPYSEVADFDELPIPFRCVAVDLVAGRAEVLAGGRLLQALRATISLPGVFDPVPLDGMLMMDGGVLNNVPADVVRGLGADTVVAVDVAPPESKQPEPSLTGVAGRAIDIMMADLTSRRLVGADLVIRPDLTGFLSSDFARSEELWKRGYDAAAAAGDALAAWALSEEEWEAHLATRRARRRTAPSAVSFVELEGGSRAAAARLARVAEKRLLGPLDATRIERGLGELVGTGRFASASYEAIQRDARDGLRVSLREKVHAPPMVNFFLDVNNEQEDFDLNVGARATFMDPTTFGSELRVDVSVGSTLALAAEVLQPLGLGGAFVAPRLFASSGFVDYYEDTTLVANYKEQRTGGGVDLGLRLGRAAELRAGAASAYRKETVRIGDPVQPDVDGREDLLRASLSVDGADAAVIPRGGIRLQSTAEWYLHAPAAEQEFGRAWATLLAAKPVGRRDSLQATLSGGASFGGSLPTVYDFTLGGPFRISGLGLDALRGESYALGRLQYLKGVSKSAGLIVKRAYLTAFVEAGSAFDRASDARVRWSGSIGFAANTFFGPAFVGLSVAGKNDVKLYVSLGQVVR
jgi:NTE family protein